MYKKGGGIYRKIFQKGGHEPAVPPPPPNPPLGIAIHKLSLCFVCTDHWASGQQCNFIEVRKAIIPDRNIARKKRKSTVSFFSEDNVLSDEIKICYIFEYQSNEHRAFLFIWDTRYSFNL